MKNTHLLMLTIMGLTACNVPEKDNHPKMDSATQSASDTTSTRRQPDAPAPISREYQTKTGKTWVLTEWKTSASQSTLQVSSKGFTSRNDSVKIEGTDPLEQVLLADLNKDGFEEIYFITRSSGSGSDATIYGFSSNKDKSFSGIHVQEVTDKDVSKDGKLEGYMGHDSIYVHGSLLARQFPIYKSGDANAVPTGGKRIVYYALKPGESTWQLLIKNVTQSR